METLEKSRMCRLCGKNSGIAIDIFDKDENHVRKINAILPILVHKMDLLPKQMCHRCSYKLEEFYKFYVDCAKTDSELKSQLSWMRKETLEEKNFIPMVKMNKFKVKTEPNSDDYIDNSVRFGEESLIFPASVLIHNYDPNTAPTIRSHCHWCNQSSKMNKVSPKQLPQKGSENEVNISNVISSVSNSDNDFNEPKTVKENSIVNFNDSESIKQNCIFNDDSVKNDISNRALRPRKGSIDYIGQKKKGNVPNLKEKLKSNLDMFNPSLVTPVTIKVTDEKIHATPLIKLEKVDDAMKQLRTRKNLEEFNKRIKELQKKKILVKSDKNNKFLKRTLQKSELYIKNLRTLESRRKSLQKEDNLIKKSVQKDEIKIRKSLEIEENQKDNSLQNSNTYETIQTEENQTRKSTQTSLQQSSNFNSKVTVNDITRIKQECIITNQSVSEKTSEQLVQENSLNLENCKKKVSTSVDRFSLCTVKLEKDYTCNGEYPLIKIKRHLAVANSQKSQNGASKLPVEQDSIYNVSPSIKLLNKSEGSISPKNLRNKTKRLSVSNKGKLTNKEKKKKDLVTAKQSVDKGVLNVSQSDIKRYCEECDTSFRNKELYRLHPCYQK